MGDSPMDPWRGLPTQFLPRCANALAQSFDTSYLTEKKAVRMWYCLVVLEQLLHEQANFFLDNCRR